MTEETKLPTWIEQQESEHFKPNARHKDIDTAARVFVALDHEYWDNWGGLWILVAKSAAHDLLRRCGETKPRAHWQSKDLYLWPADRDE